MDPKSIITSLVIQAQKTKDFVIPDELLVDENFYPLINFLAEMMSDELKDHLGFAFSFNFETFKDNKGLPNTPTFREALMRACLTKFL